MIGALTGGKGGTNVPYNFSKVSCGRIGSVPRSSRYLVVSRAPGTHKRSYVSEYLKKIRKDIPTPPPLNPPGPSFPLGSRSCRRQKRPEERGFKL